MIVRADTHLLNTASDVCHETAGVGSTSGNQYTGLGLTAARVAGCNGYAFCFLTHTQSTMREFDRVLLHASTVHAVLSENVMLRRILSEIVPSRSEVLTFVSKIMPFLSKKS